MKLRILVSLLLLGSLASADEFTTTSNKPKARKTSKQWFALEIKFGPYRPNIDASSGLAPGTHPYADLFSPLDKPGSRPSPGLLTQLELDFQFFNRFGSIAVGGTVGYFRKSASALRYINNDNTMPCSVEAGNCERSGDGTALNIVPLTLLAVYRFDVLALRYKFPLVPYVKIGLGYYFWWIQDGSDGVAHVQDGANRIDGRGGTWGWLLHPGVAFLLDVLDPAAAQAMDNEAGINHSYLFIELNYADISGFGAGQKLNLSDLSLNTGLTFEF